MATKKTEAKVEEATVEKTPVDPMEEYVEIELFKDGGKYRDDLFVSVNGENCIVQRGVPVKIKRKFAEVIKNSMEQSNRAASEIIRLSE